MKSIANVHFLIRSRVVFFGIGFCCLIFWYISTNGTKHVLELWALNIMLSIFLGLRQPNSLLPSLEAQSGSANLDPHKSKHVKT